MSSGATARLAACVSRGSQTGAPGSAYWSFLTCVTGVPRAPACRALSPRHLHCLTGAPAASAGSAIVTHFANWGAGAQRGHLPKVVNALPPPSSLSFVGRLLSCPLPKPISRRTPRFLEQSRGVSSSQGSRQGGLCSNRSRNSLIFCCCFGLKAAEIFVQMKLNVVPHLSAVQETRGSILGLGRSLGGGHGNSLQYSCLENPLGQRSLVGYSPWGRKESDRTEQSSTQHKAYSRRIVELLYLKGKFKGLESLPAIPLSSIMQPECFSHLLSLLPRLRSRGPETWVCVHGHLKPKLGPRVLPALRTLSVTRTLPHLLDSVMVIQTHFCHEQPSLQQFRAPYDSGCVFGLWSLVSMPGHRRLP